MVRDERERWRRLMELLQPIHDRARSSARRLSSSVEEGDDLFQEALLRAFEKLPGLRDPDRFAGWFYAILITVHRNRGRRAFWRRFLRLDDVFGETGTAPEPACPPSGPEAPREGAERVWRALGRLPAVQREAIVLHDLDDLPLEEIARLQRVTLSAVKTRVARGRERLRRHYEHRFFGRATTASGPGKSAAERREEHGLAEGKG
jgi:RNA polymerase sigma-70 factor (ECF subfamily)